MIKGLLEIFSVFDWITPAKGFVEDMINDPTLLQTNSYTFFISLDELTTAGWNMFTVRDVLEKHGVKPWGLQLTNGEWFFSVKADQGSAAEYIMFRYEIPFSYF